MAWCNLWLNIAPDLFRYIVFMMTSSNGNIFRITGPLCVRGIYRSPVNSPHTERPVTRSCDLFFNLRLNNRLSKQSRRRWSETPTRSFWCHCNVLGRNEFNMRICIVCKCVSAVWPDPCSVLSCLPPVSAGELVHKIPWPQKCWHILHKCQGTCPKYQRPTCSPKIARYINGRVAFPQSIPGIVWRVQKSRDYRSRFYKQRSTRFIAWMSNHILSFLEDVTIQPYSKLNSCSA